MKIIFVRHGKDDDRYRGGWSDLDLIPEGEEQAKRLAKYLKENENVFHISSIISSDLRRALTTATYIGDELKISISNQSESTLLWRFESQQLYEMGTGWKLLALQLSDFDGLQEYIGKTYSSMLINYYSIAEDEGEKYEVKSTEKFSFYPQ